MAVSLLGRKAFEQFRLFIFIMKKTLLLMVTFVCVAMSYGQTLNSLSTYSAADVNHDGIVNVSDATTVVDNAIGRKEANQVVTAEDLTKVLKNLNSQITDLTNKLNDARTEIDAMRAELNKGVTAYVDDNISLLQKEWIIKGNSDAYPDGTMTFTSKTAVKITSVWGEGPITKATRYRYFTNTKKIVFYDSNLTALFVADVLEFVPTGRMVLLLEDGSTKRLMTLIPK